MKKGKEILLAAGYVAPRATSIEFTNEGFLLSSSEEVLTDEFEYMYFDGEDPENPLDPQDPEIIIF